MTRHDITDRYGSILSSASGEEMLLMAVLGSARVRRQIHQELGRRALGAAAARPPRRLERQRSRLSLAA